MNTSISIVWKLYDPASIEFAFSVPAKQYSKWRLYDLPNLEKRISNSIWIWLYIYIAVSQ